MAKAEKVASSSIIDATRGQRKDNAEPILASPKSDPNTQSDPKLIPINPGDDKSKKRSMDKPEVKVSIADPVDKRRSNPLAKRVRFNFICTYR